MQTLATAFGLLNSGQLQWAHGVNTPEALAQACADPFVHMLEADVFMAGSDATPLIKPRADVTTELDVATLLQAAARAGKGVKLDFHNAAAVEPTLAILRKLNPTIPPLLHADVFTLLGHAQHEALEPEQFLKQCGQAMPRALLSLGWSLKRSHDADGRMEEALIYQVASMLAEKLGARPYTMEIRAGYRPTRNGVAGERGAAVILEPLPPVHPAEGDAMMVLPSNVVSIIPHLRRVA
jgi:Uncharacterized conserved protein (DUF2181)